VTVDIRVDNPIPINEMHIIEYAVVSNGKKNLNRMELNAI
jgi:hypothetical protein